MKRLPLLLLSLCSAFVVLAGDIRSAKELVAFADAVNNGADISAWQNDKGEVALACDINMKSVKHWHSIKRFEGVFDGKGFALTNWKT